MENNIRLKSVEGIFYDITPGLERHSKLIKKKLEIRRNSDNINQEEKEEEIIDIPFRGNVIEKVIEWCELHENDSFSLFECKEDLTVSEMQAYQIPPTDAEFLKANNLVFLTKISEVAELLKIQVLHITSYLMGSKILRDIPDEELTRLVNEDYEDYINNFSLWHPNGFK